MSEVDFKLTICNHKILNFEKFLPKLYVLVIFSDYHNSSKNVGQSDYRLKIDQAISISDRRFVIAKYTQPYHVANRRLEDFLSGPATVSYAHQFLSGY